MALQLRNQSPRNQPEAPKESVPGGKKRKKFDGTAILAAVIGTDGQVCSAKVLRSLREDLDKKALEKVKQWKFKPAEKNGKPVAVQIVVEITFHLD